MYHSIYIFEFNREDIRTYVDTHVRTYVVTIPSERGSFVLFSLKHDKIIRISEPNIVFIRWRYFHRTIPPGTQRY